jgi:GntR family transcriptional regulator
VGAASGGNPEGTGQVASQVTSTPGPGTRAPFDRRSVVLRLRDELQDLVRSRRLSANDQMPTEAEIAEQFGVSRTTVREAYKLMEQDGQIVVRHGRGRFVSALAGLRVERPVTEFESVNEMLTNLGYQPKTRVLALEAGPPTAPEAQALELDPDEGIIRVRRLRLHDDEPLVLSVNTFRQSLLGGVDVHALGFEFSITEWLGTLGRAPVSSAAEIGATFLPADMRTQVGRFASEPWLVTTERCVDHTGSPVLFSCDYHRGDIFTFRVLRRRTSDRPG